MFLSDADQSNVHGPCPMQCHGVLYTFLPEVRQARCDQCDYIEQDEQDESEARAEAAYRELDKGEL